jgi:hypothetical protein
MSHQIYFYLHPEDVRDVEAMWRRKEPLLVLGDTSTTPHPRVLPGIAAFEHGSRVLFTALVRAADIADVVMASTSPTRWTVDAARSPVIELKNSFFDGAVVRRGRAYYVDRYFLPDDGFEIARERSGEFKVWARALFAAMKRSLTRVGSEYVGPRALEWAMRGEGMLVDMNGRNVLERER